MPTLCVQCSLRAFVEGRASVMFDEDPEEHRARFHPDPEETRRERVELERIAAQMLGLDNHKDR